MISTIRLVRIIRSGMTRLRNMYGERREDFGQEIRTAVFLYYLDILISTYSKIMGLGRIRRTAELLTNVRTLKMYGWEFLFASWLTKTRSVEVAYLSVRQIYYCLQAAI